MRYYVEITHLMGGACIWTGIVQADTRYDAEIVALETAEIPVRHWDSLQYFVEEI